MPTHWEPRRASGGGTTAYRRPKPGTRTARVWEIADAVTRERGRLATVAEVRERVVSEAGNGRTANTQYYHWKAHRAARSELNAPTPPGANRLGDVPPQSLRVAPDGRIVVPAAMRDAMRIGPDGRVVAQVEDGELRVISSAVAVEQVQASMQRYKQPEESVVDEFLAERRTLWGEE
ncbi:MAG: hypothetical protein F4Z04_12475 [Acidobacteria bacterium]|nr:hypothetical protein [Acidobacteriota bacterium]